MKKKLLGAFLLFSATLLVPAGASASGAFAELVGGAIAVGRAAEKLLSSVYRSRDDQTVQAEPDFAAAKSTKADKSGSARQTKTTLESFEDTRARLRGEIEDIVDKLKKVYQNNNTQKNKIIDAVVSAGVFTKDELNSRPLPKKVTGSADDLNHELDKHLAAWAALMAEEERLAEDNSLRENSNEDNKSHGESAREGDDPNQTAENAVPVADPTSSEGDSASVISSPSTDSDKEDGSTVSARSTSSNFKRHNSTDVVSDNGSLGHRRSNSVGYASADKKGLTQQNLATHNLLQSDKQGYKNPNPEGDTGSEVAGSQESSSSGSTGSQQDDAVSLSSRSVSTTLRTPKGANPRTPEEATPPSSNPSDKLSDLQPSEPPVAQAMGADKKVALVAAVAALAYLGRKIWLPAYERIKQLISIEKQA